MTTIRQTPQTSSVTLEGLLAWFDGYVAALPDSDKNLIQTAFDLAKEHYPADALTTYGEPLMEHFLGSMQIVSELDLLPDAVAATICPISANTFPLGANWLPNAATAPFASWSKAWTKYRN